jgi:O-antigen ligase
MNQSRNFYFNILSILSSCLIPLLVTGPFLPDFLLSLMSLWFLYYSLKHKMYSIYYNPYFFAFIFFWLVCILSSLLSDEILFSLKSSIFYFRIGIFALLISYLIDQNKKILNYFYFSFLITFSILILDGYFQYFTGSNVLGYKIIGPRTSSFFGDELIMGSYLVRLLPLLIALFIVKENKQIWEYYFFPVFLILVAILIFMAGERASLFFLIMFSLFLLCFLSCYKWMRISIVIILFSLLSLLIIKNPKVKARYFEETTQSMGANSSKKYFFTPEHDSLIRTAWSMFLDKPILGHGPKLFRVKCKVYGNGRVNPCNTHPHNFYVQLLAETGIVGFSFLAGLFIYFFYLIVRHVFERIVRKHIWLSDYQICLLAGLLITIWPITTNGSIFNNYLMILYGLQMGFFPKKEYKK